MLQVFFKHILFITTMLFVCINGYAENSSDEYWIERYLSVSYPLKHIEVTSKYGLRKDPFTGKKTYHGGIDLRAKNEMVMSMFDGYVDTIGYDTRSGLYIRLVHDDYEISYCHLSKVLAREGESIMAGDIVGISGNTGRSTGSHLHITCRYNGEKINPYRLLSQIRSTRKECIKALGVNYDKKAYRNAFIEEYSEAAIEQQRMYGIPASVTLAQMALESSWGNSRLAQIANNYFGIKANRLWLEQDGSYILSDDDRKNEKFCVFEDVYEGMEYHSKILTSSRYARCTEIPQWDYMRWLKAIKDCGYATNPNYVKECAMIIRQYHLYDYDDIVIMENDNFKIKDYE